MNPLCIYHGGCDDGFASALIVNDALGDQVDFHYGIYQTDPPDVTNRDVLLVDFSYKAPVIHEMAAKARTLLIIDHHKSAAEDLAGIPAPPTGPYDPDGMVSFALEYQQPAAVYALFDMKRSGAGLTWDYFFEHPRPWLIDYIEDRDIWRKPPMPNRDEIIMALRSYPQDFETWRRIINAGESAFLDEGRAIHRYYRTIVDALKENAVRREIAGVEVPVVNSPYHFASELAGELAEGEAFAACYWNHAHGTTYSLRSREDGMDVSQVAAQYGGGGHRGAAGFKVPEPL